MKPALAKKAGLTAKSESIPRKAVFWLTISLLVLIPLAFNTGVHRIYAIPKLALLLVGASALVPLIAFSALNAAYHKSRSARLFKSRHVIITALFMLVVLTSTILSSDPVASLFGHFYNQMGLITRLCFFVCFIGLIDGIDLNQTRLATALWAVTFAGLWVSAYAVAQFFGYDPFLPSVLYTTDSPAGTVVRVIGTLGHADYLGNFLLYTTPVSAGLAIAAGGRARALALLATALSTVAIVSSGTRGAWVGLVSAIVVFATLNLRAGAGHSLRARRRQVVRAATLAFLAILVLSLAMSLSPASRSIVARARLSFSEGFTGAGRTSLWRDSIKMVPAFALTGSGPDNFRKAFLPYKSKELGRIAPINSESSHNSYLDAAISFGVPGFLLYVAVIVSTFRLLLRARRRTTSHRMRIIITGIISSLAGVAVHNFFIFDQIPTGLYFFAFAALAQVVSNIVDSQVIDASEASSPKIGTPVPVSVGSKAISEVVTVVAGCMLVIVAVWYSVSLVQADAAINRAMMSADAGDLNQVMRNGARAADGPEITGEYNFLFARALVLCADRLDTRSNVQRAEVGGLIAARDRAIELAAARAQKSLAHTQTPDLNYLLLAYLALVKDDVVKLRAYADEAARWDPNHFRTRWMLAEAYLASGDRNRAAQEAEIALDLDPTSSEAKSVLARARGETESLETKIEGIIAQARRRAEAGKLDQARRVLDRALKLSNGPCPECHRALALVYESGNQYQNAITEWQIFMTEAPDRASAEQIASRIEALSQKR
jgi:O-antigen ligase/tetratricopeptide (TPR) repeat protein